MMIVGLNQYQDLSKRTMNDLQPKREQFSNYCLGLGGEAGEVLDCAKKYLHHGHDLNLTHIEKELGDVMFYVCAIATLCGLTLEDIAETNVAKLKRRYPDGFSHEKSINRVD